MFCDSTLSPFSPIQVFKETYGPIRYVMAPMAGITDSTFRTLIREMGADTVFSELVSAEGLVRGGQKTRDLIFFDPIERPIGIQIFGCRIESMVEAAKIIEGEGADFVDLNFGCPVKKMVQNSGGAAWLKDLPGLGRLLSQMRGEVGIPLTVKIRSGWDEKSINAGEIVRIAAECGVAWVAIHARTRSQGYSGRADWELIRTIARNSSIPVVGNGDITTAEQAKEKINEGFCHAVMIGRGALRNPWIFREIREGRQLTTDFAKFINRHFELAFERKEPERALQSLKKHMAWYVVGFRGASVFRKRLFEIQDKAVLKEYCLNFFQNTPLICKEDGQPFMLGGHG